MPETAVDERPLGPFQTTSEGRDPGKTPESLMPLGMTMQSETEPRAKPVPGPLPKSVLAQYDAIQASVRETDALGERRAKLETTFAEKTRAEEVAAAAVAESTRTRVKPAVAAVEAATKAEQKPVPTTEAAPKAPDQGLRPFLEPRNAQGALEDVILGLGLIAQMVAARGAPVAAMAALTGAMTGWKEGEHDRAEVDWRKYLAEVDRVKGHNAELFKVWDAEMKKSAGNTAQANARLTAVMVEQKEVELAALASTHGADRVLQELNTVDTHIGHVMQQTNSLIQRMGLDEYRRSRSAQHEREFAARQEATAEARKATLDLRQMRGGPWIDTQARGISVSDNFTREEWNAAGGHDRFRKIQPMQQQTAQLIEGQGFPALEQLKYLAPRILARHKGQNLGQLVANYAAGKLSDDEVRQFEQARTTLAYEESRAMGGSTALRKFTSEMLLKTEVPNLGDRAQTADRMLENSRTMLMNYIREIKGWKAFTYPSMPRSVEAVNSKTGETVQVKLGAYEPLPAGYEYKY